MELFGLISGNNNLLIKTARYQRYIAIIGNNWQHNNWGQIVVIVIWPDVALRY
jgi:hypothetical protein